MAATRRVRAFKRWMKSQGIECSDALQLCDCPSTGLSVKALCDLSEGDVVARIPKQACLTIRTNAARELIEAAGLDGCLGLSVALMFERSLGNASAWAPYLHLLPYQECLPLVWTSKEVDSLLCGTELHKDEGFFWVFLGKLIARDKAVKEDKVLIYEDWKESILPLLELESFQLDPSFFDIKDYFAAKTLIASRSFEIDDYHGFGMVPLSDLYNHKTAAEDVHFTSVSSHSESDTEGDRNEMSEQSNDDDYDNERDQEHEPTPVSSMDNVELGIAFSKRKSQSDSHLEDMAVWGHEPAALEMIMIKDVKVGAEVYNTYGSLGNAALLHRYGFTEPDNPFDIVNIDLELVLQWSLSLFSSRRSRARVSLWRKLGYSGCVSQNSEYFEISFDGEPQIELLIVLHILLLPEDAYHKLDFAVAAAGKLEEFKGDFGMFLFEGTSEMNRDTLMNKNVGSALLTLVNMRECLYGTSSLEDDIEALERCCPIKERKLYHSLMLRISERRILEKCRTYVADAARMRIRKRASTRRKVKRTRNGDYGTLL
ncbi:hypothetical protein L484_027993 [Morus notabilis]|uniref:N-lysine methyltransferase n=1 Tax=Morus notabilis TaxID=981085 RepID=W9SI89_9ROSA|nr:hypothetical protein L484_027993 [Morus notabilis]